MPSAQKQVMWAFLAGVDVLAPESAATIIAFGDSITDGSKSTVDTNHRWPDFLAARLLARRGAAKLAVVDMGIGGNRVLNDGATSGSPRAGVNALARFDEDVLAVPGAKYLIVLEGINDIGRLGAAAKPIEQITPRDIIAGLRQMIDRAHSHGIAVIGCTLTPFEGEAQSARGYYAPEKEKLRAEVNDWIRGGNAYDGVIDFDRVVRDPNRPTRFLAAFDSGDQLHPGDAGYKAMADAIDLNLFRPASAPRTGLIAGVPGRP
jgi:lysophospholipase L1-like esterase